MDDGMLLDDITSNLENNSEAHLQQDTEENILSEDGSSCRSPVAKDTFNKA